MYMVIVILDCQLTISGMNYNTELESTPAEKELEIPDIPWLNVDEGILRLRKMQC